MESAGSPDVRQRPLKPYNSSRLALRSIRSGASVHPYYCTPHLTVPDVLGALAVTTKNRYKYVLGVLAVWRQNKTKNVKQ